MNSLRKPTGPRSGLLEKLLRAPWTAPADLLERLLLGAETQVARVAEALGRRLDAGERVSILVHGPPGSGRSLLAAGAARRAAGALARPVHEVWLDGRLAGGPPVALLTETARAVAARRGDPRYVGRLAALHDLPAGAAEKAAMGLIDELLADDLLLLVMENLDFLPVTVPLEAWSHVTEWIARNARVALVGLADPIERRRADLDFEAWFSPLGGHAETFRARPVEERGAVRLAETVRGIVAPGAGQPEDASARAFVLQRLTGGRRRWLIACLACWAEQPEADVVADAGRAVGRLAGELDGLLERISPQQRRLLAALADARCGLTVRELARRCFCSPQAVSSQLGLLRGSEFVHAERQGRETFYRFADPLLAAHLEWRGGEATELEHEIRFLHACAQHAARSSDPDEENPLESLFAADPASWRDRIPRLIDALRRAGRPGALAASLAALAARPELVARDAARTELWRDLWAEWSGRDRLIACAVRLIDASLHRVDEGEVRARARLSPLLAPARE